MISYILQFLCLFSPCLWLFILLFVNYICTLRVQHKNSPPDSTETSGGLLTVMVFLHFLYEGSAKSISFCFAQPINCSAFSSLFFR